VLGEHRSARRLGRFDERGSFTWWHRVKRRTSPKSSRCKCRSTSGHDLLPLPLWAWRSDRRNKLNCQNHARSLEKAGLKKPVTNDQDAAH
jgi:hypothetical protein